MNLWSLTLWLLGMITNNSSVLWKEWWVNIWGVCGCNGGSIRACDPKQFSFQLQAYQQDSYRDPSSHSGARFWINLKSISWSSIMLTGADLWLWHWTDNHLNRKVWPSLARMSLNWTEWPRSQLWFESQARHKNSMLQPIRRKNYNLYWLLVVKETTVVLTIYVPTV